MNSTERKFSGVVKETITQDQTLLIVNQEKIRGRIFMRGRCVSAGAKIPIAPVEKVTTGNRG